MGKRLNVLIACEESGVVRDTFRMLGHNAWSCDLQPCSPSPFSHFHIQGDAVAVAAAPWTVPQIPTVVGGPWWDLMIAHPPCTYLCNSGVRWLYNPPKPSGEVTLNHARYAQLDAAAAFFKILCHQHQIPHIAVENPIMHCWARVRCSVGKPTQTIQPWMFGHPETKATCLWLKNLPNLIPRVDAKYIKALMKRLPKKLTNSIHYASPGPNRAKLRSKTYPGIALAMAMQWSDYILNL